MDAKNPSLLIPQLTWLFGKETFAYQLLADIHVIHEEQNHGATRMILSFTEI